MPSAYTPGRRTRPRSTSQGNPPTPNLTHVFSEVVNEARLRQDVHCRQGVLPRWVIMISVDGEYGQTDVQVWIFEVNAAATTHPRGVFLCEGGTGRDGRETRRKELALAR